MRATTPEMLKLGETLLWRSYDAISCPTLLLRGADSDLLLRETALAMQSRGYEGTMPGNGTATADAGQWWSAMVVPVAGAIGAVTTAFVVFRIARRGAGFLLTDLLLAGFAVGSMLTAATTAVLVLNDQMAVRLRLVFSWLAGGIAVNGWGHLAVAAPVVLVGLVVAYGLAHWLDPLVLGEAGEWNQSLEQAGRVADFIELGELMCRDALMREESCGGHFREEFQTEEGEAQRDDANYMYVSAWECKGNNEYELHREEFTCFSSEELCWYK